MSKHGACGESISRRRLGAGRAGGKGLPKCGHLRYTTHTVLVHAHASVDGLLHGQAVEAHGTLGDRILDVQVGSRVPGIRHKLPRRLVHILRARNSVSHAVIAAQRRNLPDHEFTVLSAQL